MPTILIVDDMPIFREPIEAVLRAEGFETVTAANGQEALTALAARKPDLVLLDLGMPGIDGIAVLRKMRADPATRSIPVLVLSAEIDRGRVKEAAGLGIAGYLLKANFSLKDTLAKVKALLAGGSTVPGKAPPASKATAAVTKAATHTAATPAAARSPAPSSMSSPARASPAAAPAPARPASNAPSVPSSGDAATVEVDVKALKPIIARSDLLERLKACEELKGFSPTISQVLKLTASDKSSIEKITKAISQDQAMVLKILKLANSSVYSRGDRVDTVQRAVLRIGIASIHQTVLNIAVVERFSSPAFKDLISTQQFWEHSIACGIICSEIAHSLGMGDCDSAFTSGLLHDLGRVIFAEALGDSYVHVIETARRLQAPLELVESRMLLLNHADVMDRLLSSWQFPKPLVDPIMYHHLSAGNARTVAPARVAEILRLGLANRLAHAMLLGSSGNDTIYPTEDHCRVLNLSTETVRAIEETCRQQSDDAKFALLANSSNSGVWPRQADQVRATLKAPFRPLYVSAAPEFDAYRIFCNELAGARGDEPANVLVVHLAGAKDREPLADRVAEVEKEAGLAGLPMLVLSPGGQLTMPERCAGARKSLVVPTPMSVQRMVETMNALLSASDVRMAA